MSQLGGGRTAESERSARKGLSRRTRRADDQRTHTAQVRTRQHTASDEHVNGGSRVAVEMRHLRVAGRRRAITRALLLADAFALTVAYAIALPAGIGSSASAASQVEMFVLVLLS